MSKKYIESVKLRSDDTNPEKLHDYDPKAFHNKKIIRSKKPQYTGNIGFRPIMLKKDSTWNIDEKERYAVMGNKTILPGKKMNEFIKNKPKEKKDSFYKDLDDILSVNKNKIYQNLEYIDKYNIYKVNSHQSTR